MTSGQVHRHRGRIAAAAGLAAAAAALAAGGWLATRAAAAQLISITNGGCSGGGTLYCFSPEAVTVPVGTPVSWMNSSSAPQHTATLCTSAACSGAPANSGSDSFNVSVGSTPGSFTFTTPGTYTYYCTIHGYAAMHGSITVTASGGGGSPTPSASSGAASSPTTPATGASIGAASGSVGLLVAGIGLLITLATLVCRRRDR